MKNWTWGICFKSVLKNMPASYSDTVSVQEVKGLKLPTTANQLLALNIPSIEAPLESTISIHVLQYLFQINKNQFQLNGCCEEFAKLNLQDLPGRILGKLPYCLGKSPFLCGWKSHSNPTSWKKTRDILSQRPCLKGKNYLLKGG